MTTEAVDNKIALIKRHHARIWDSEGWKEFRNIRSGSWDQLIRRRMSQTLNPAAAQFLQATNTRVDIQSPDLEKDLHDRVAIQMSNAAKVDAISLDSSTKAKEDVEDIRIFSAGSWLKQDDGGAIRRHCFEQMDRYGVAVIEKTYSEPEEPESLSDDPKKALAEREQHYRDSEHECFGWRPSSPLQMAWWPANSNPQIFVGEEIVPYEEAREFTDEEGRNIRLTKNNDLIFIGDGLPLDEIADNAWHGTEIKVVTHAMKDKQSGRWVVSKWVRSGKDAIGKAQKLEEYECPFKHPPFFVVPSGDELVTETNPHLRYRPMLYPLIVDVQELNALVTLLVMTAVWHIQNPFYVRLDRLDANQLSAIEGLAAQGFGSIEGVGAERKFVFRTPEAGTGEVMAAPALEAMPNANLPEAFAARIQRVQQNIESHKANRYLTGDALDVTSDQPATTTLNQAEAAATPFGPYMANVAAFIKDWLVAEHEAIVYSNEGLEGKAEVPFPYRVRGDEPVISDSRDAGDEVSLTATKIKRAPYVLTVIIRNETQAERAMNEQLADIAYEKGADSKEQWLRKRGYDDPRKQEEILWQDKMDRASEDKFMSVMMQDVENLFMALSGMSPALVQNQQGGMPPGGGQSPTGQQTEQPGYGVNSGTAPVVAGPEGRSVGGGVM